MHIPKCTRCKPQTTVQFSKQCHTAQCSAACSTVQHCTAQYYRGAMLRRADAVQISETGNMAIPGPSKYHSGVSLVEGTAVSGPTLGGNLGVV